MAPGVYRGPGGQGQGEGHVVGLSIIFYWLLWDLENPMRRNWKLFHRCTHAESDSRLLFQKWSKLEQDKWPKGRVALITRMLANAQRDGCPAEQRWRTLFNAAKFG